MFGIPLSNRSLKKFDDLYSTTSHVLFFELSMTRKYPLLSKLIYSQLPLPFRITDSQNSEIWHGAYDALKQAYDSFDFASIQSVLTELCLFSEFQINSPPEDLEIPIVELFFKIITTSPIQNYETQLNACYTFHKSIGSSTHRMKGKITLPWKPLFDFAYFLVFKSDIKHMTDRASSKENAILIAPDFSPFFTEEATNEILDYLLPRISPNSGKTGIYMVFLTNFIPIFHMKYKEWLPDFIKDIHNIGSTNKMSPFFHLLSNVVRHNLNDDFSFLLPIIANNFLSIITNDTNPNDMGIDLYSDSMERLSGPEFITRSLAKSLVLLCLSPPTQKAAIEQLTITLFGLRDRYHPSLSLNIPEYLSLFVQYFIEYFAGIYDEFSRENNFLPANIKPSQETIDLILKPVVDLHLIMIHTVEKEDHTTLIRLIRIICELYPSALPRYFEYGFQCITLTDVECVAEQGWAVLTAVVINLRKTELFKQHIQVLFDNAVNSMAVLELQEILMSFFLAVFSVFPFNEDLVSDDLKDFPFEHFAVKFISSLFDAGQSFPSIQGKFADVEPPLKTYTGLAIQTFLSGCSKKTLNAIYPILESALSNHALTHAFIYFSVIYNYYFLTAEDEKKQSLLKAMEKVLLANPDVLTTSALLARYLSGSMLSAKCNDDFLKALEFVQPFLEHHDKKVRKAASSAIGNAFGFHRLVIVAKPGKETMISFDEFQYELFEAKIDVNKIAEQILTPIIDQLISIKDPIEFLDLLKEKKWLLALFIKSVFEVEEGELNNLYHSNEKNPFYIKEFICKDVPVRRLISKLIIYALNAFPNHVQIFETINYLLVGLLNPVIGLHLTNIQIEEQRLRALWPFRRDPYVFNSFCLASLLNLILLKRSSYYTCPLSPSLKEIFLAILPHVFSPFSQIRDTIIRMIAKVYDPYLSFFIENVMNLLTNTQFDSVDEILPFFTNEIILQTTARQEKLLCQFFRIICMKLRSEEQSTMHLLDGLCHFFFAQTFPFGAPKESSEVWDSLLSDLFIQLKKEAHNNRTLNIVAVTIITSALKHIQHVSDEVVLYLLELTKVYDAPITLPALGALTTILRRQRKQTVEVKPMPSDLTLADYPPLINGKYPYNPSSTEATAEAFISNFHDQYIQPLNGSLNLSEYVRIFDKSANGYHRYSKTYTIKHQEFHPDSIIIPHLPEILMSSIFSGDEQTVLTIPHFCYFWKHVAKIIGPASFKVLIPIIEDLISNPMNEQTVASLSDLITSYIFALPFYSDEDSIEFQDKILGPFIIITSQNPLTIEYANLVFPITSSSVSLHRFWPLCNFLADNASMSLNSSLSRRRLFEPIISMMGFQCHTCCTSVDLLFIRFIQPYFENYDDYHAQLALIIFSLYFSLVVAVSLPTSSPKYSKEILPKQKFLIEQADKILKNGDPTQKSFHLFLTNLLNNMQGSDSLSLDQFVPLFIDNLEQVLRAVNTADVITEDKLYESLTSFLYLPYLLYLPDLSIKIIEKMIHNFDILSAPMQLKFLDNIEAMLEDLLTIISAEQRHSIYLLLSDLFDRIKNENVLITILESLGLILWSSPPPENISLKEAEAFLMNALIFDEVPDQIIKSFEIVSEAIENLPRNKTRFVQKVVNTFWTKNADHMLPKASAILEPYRLLVSAHYIA